MQKIVGKYQGRDVLETVLENARHRVHILNYGSTVRRWVVNDCLDIVLGFDSFESYPAHSRSFGILAGRVANRTRHGRFSLQGQPYQLSINHGPHHLHGGSAGLGERLWDVDTDTQGNRVQLTYFSPHNEEGYPANVRFTVTWSLTADGLHCIMEGQPDGPTPINLAQHSYYNLDPLVYSEGEGQGDIKGNDITRHALQIDANEYLPVDAELIPTGARETVSNTRFDFRTLAQISQLDPARQGHDHNLVLRPGRDTSQPAARLVSSDKNTILSLITTEPGIQLYTAAALALPQPGIEGRPFVPFGGICLEAQHFPDSLNCPDFPSIISTPEQPYHQALSVLVQHEPIRGQST